MELGAEAADGKRHATAPATSGAARAVLPKGSKYPIFISGRTWSAKRAQKNGPSVGCNLNFGILGPLCWALWRSR